MAVWQKASSLDRPETLESVTVKVKTECGSMYMTIGSSADKQVEAIIKLGKAGGCAAAFCEAIGRLLTRALQRGDDLEGLIGMLSGISCFSGKNSCPDAISKAMLKAKEEKNDVLEVTE